MKSKNKKKVTSKSLIVSSVYKRGKGTRRVSTKTGNEAEAAVGARSGRMGPGVTGSNTDIFDRNKLGKILKGLASSKPGLTVPEKSKVNEKVTTANIFNEERLKKISRGLRQHVNRDDDSDCCVVYSGPVVTAKKRDKSGTVVNHRRTRRNEESKRSVDGGATSSIAGPPIKTPASIKHSPKSIFDVDKLNKILNGIRSCPVSTVANKMPSKRFRAEVEPTVDAVKTKTDHLATAGPTASMALRDRMVERLNAARFRYINETLYSSSGTDAETFFREDPEAFNVYHSGYRSQVSKWPISPLDVIIDDINKLSGVKLVADFGCGDAKLAQSVRNKVYSFDLVALNECVIACNMSKVPLAERSVDVAVFCLSLMGTNLSDYIAEANRVLKIGGVLKIAEVESRFDNVKKFIQQLNKMGFALLKQNTSHKMFVMLDFKKEECCKRRKLPTITLRPCTYKKR